MQQRNVLFKIVICVSILQCLYVRAASNFPLEEFKNFISSKPTIEVCEFRVKTKRIVDHSLKEGTFRKFSLVFGSDETYRLIEDERDYVVKVPVPVAPDSEELKIVDGRSARGESAYVRFDNQISATLGGSNTVISTSIPPTGSKPAIGPGARADMMMRVAYDLLNFGIIDIGTNGIIWNGLSFHCPSNTLSREVFGNLILDEAGIPKEIDYSIHVDSSKFRYIASFQFTNSPQIPKFFPHQVKIERFEAAGRVELANYEVARVSSSHRELTQSDIAYAPFSSTNTMQFIFSNRETFKVVKNGTTNQLVHIPQFELSKSRGWSLWLFLAFFLLSIPILRYISRGIKDEELKRKM